jgi:hypothetical protein
MAKDLKADIIKGCKTTSEKIRRLAEAGYTHSEIATFLGKRYQHIYNVLVAAGIAPKSQTRMKPPMTEFVSEPIKLPITAKKSAETPMPATKLKECGFRDCGTWKVVDGKLTLTGSPPDQYGVYAIIRDDDVVYIGVSKSVKRRLLEYRVGPEGQATSKRVNELIRLAIEAKCLMSLMVATPGKTTWMNLPVELAPGLEAAMIEKMQPEWNKKGVVIA